MKLSPVMQTKLIDEIRYVIEKMRATQNPVEKLYYISAIFGMAQRIFNFEHEPELVFLHQVVHDAYNSINSRVTLMTQRLEGGASLPGDIFIKLEEAFIKLANRIENNQKIYDVLQDISNLAYSATGNGYYLYTKGILKI